MRTLPLVRLSKIAAVMAVIAIAAAACGNSTATPAPTQPGASSAGQTSVAPTAVASAGSSAAPSAAPATQAAATGAAPTALVIPSFTSDKELEATLPDTYKNLPLRKFSFTGKDLMSNASQDNADLAALLQALGKTAEDLSYAIAADSTDTLGVSFGAYRIKGADASAWSGTLWDLAQKESPGTVSTDVNLGGKSVKRVVEPDSEDITYAWPKGDILFLVITTSDELAADAIASMR